jgi:hypothetical protein
MLTVGPGTIGSTYDVPTAEARSYQLPNTVSTTILSSLHPERAYIETHLYRLPYVPCSRYHSGPIVRISKTLSPGYYNHSPYRYKVRIHSLPRGLSAYGNPIPSCQLPLSHLIAACPNGQVSNSIAIINLLRNLIRPFKFHQGRSAFALVLPGTVSHRLELKLDPSCFVLFSFRTSLKSKT